jgi:O-acetylserine/cysteine efflux transporter
MVLSHILLLVLVAAVWGFNFVAIKVGLNHLPPFTMTALRFVLTAFPAIFFVQRPKLPWGRLVAYGLILFAAQFTCMFSAIHAGLSAGLASLVMQIQAFFTIGLSMLIFRERPLVVQILGAVVAGLGIAAIALHVGGEVTWLGLMLAVAAAFCWGVGNIMTKSFGKVDMFGLIIWGNFFAALPLLVLAIVFEGDKVSVASVTGDPWPIVFAVGYNAYASTFIGYTLWSRMLARHSAALVAPFSLLVPVFGMLSAWMFLGEAYPFWKFEATILILLGLALNQFGNRVAGILGRLMKPAPAAD